MGLFGTKEKKVIEEFSKKSLEYFNDLEKDINETLEDLQENYNENREAFPEFMEFAESIKAKLNPEEFLKLQDLSQKLLKIKRCAKKGVIAIEELSRNQRRTTREAIRDFNFYFEA